MAVIIMVVGVGLMGYPWISNWLYDHSVDSTVSVYQEKIDGAGSERLPALWKEAQDYNSSLSHASAALTDPFCGNARACEGSYLCGSAGCGWKRPDVFCGYPED